MQLTGQKLILNLFHHTFEIRMGTSSDSESLSIRRNSILDRNNIAANSKSR